MKAKIEYAIIVILLLLVYIWTNNLYTLWIAAAVIGAWIIAAVINLFVAKKVKISFTILNELSEDRQLQLCVENSSIFPASHVRVVFGCQNVVFASDCNATVDCSVGGKKTSTYEVPIGSKYCGRINIDIFGIKVYDWLGITAKKLRPHGDCYFYQYPDESDEVLQEFEGNKSSDSDVNYKHVKGNDVSEILQIRKYVVGDSIKQIHWKMSAKFDDIMVKEFDRPNDMSTMLAFDYASSNDKEENKKIIEAVATISKELQQSAIGHTVYRMDTAKTKVVHRDVFEYTEYDVMLQELLGTVANGGEYSVVDHIIRHNTIERFAKVIYITSARDRSRAAELDSQEKCLVIAV